MMTASLVPIIDAAKADENREHTRIKVGTAAGITIFDPKTVRDNSTIKQAGLPTTGIPYVIVNGTVVVKDSKVLKGVFPGQPIRAAVR